MLQITLLVTFDYFFITMLQEFWVNELQAFDYDPKSKAPLIIKHAVF